MEGTPRSSLFSRSDYTHHSFSFSDFLVFHVLLFAVPVFVFVSNYLFVLNYQGVNSLKKRIKKMLFLISFWPLAFIIFNRGFRGIYVLIPTSSLDLMIKVLRAGNTVYYFFVVLIFTYVISHLLFALKSKYIIIGFVISMALLSIQPILAMELDIYTLSAFWNPLNFISYPFAAVLMIRYKYLISECRTKVVIGLLVSCALFSLFEWSFYIDSIHFPGQGYAMPAYTRPSLVLGTGLICFTVMSPSIRSNALVNYLSRNSFMLYCLHVFFITPIRLLFPVQSNPLLNWGTIFIVIVLSYLCAVILRMYLNKNVIS